MKKSEIRVGGRYLAKVNGKVVEVRVDAIKPRYTNVRGQSCCRSWYIVTNLKTGRRTTFRSAAKFRGEFLEAPSPKAPRAGGGKRRTTMPTSAPPAPATNPASLPTAAAAPPAAPESVPATDRPSAASPASPSPTTGLSTRSTPPSPGAGGGPNGSPVSLGAALQARAAVNAGTHAIAPHVIVQARAGTGKTTTLVEGLKVMRGQKPSIVPSPQQAAVWEALKDSADARSVCFVAFNKSIATELQARVPKGCDAMTMHSLGYKAVTRAFGRQEPNSWVVADLIAELLKKDLRELRRQRPELLKATEELVSLCKMNLVDGSGEGGWDEALGRLASYYDVDLNGSRSEVFALVPAVLERCKAPRGKITFDDMIWLPVALNLPVYRYDLLLVDEAQDLNRCQQALARKAGDRLILCGDAKQAIYGFAGADAESLPRMAAELGTTGRGCIELPLTVTRRCGKAIVAEAQKIVPDFEAHESNGPGLVRNAVYDHKSPACYAAATGECAPGDMLVCRVNAPLVGQCFRFLKAGRKANIMGRDVGAGLISTIKKLKAASVPDLVGKVSDWLHAETKKEDAKRTPNEARIIALQDRHDCLLAFTEGMGTVEAVIARIESVFTDDKQCLGIRLSSIHKAKGLEARRVYLLRPKGGECPHPMARSEWQKGQEMNLLYVAITRAIEELVYVN